MSESGVEEEHNYFVPLIESHGVKPQLGSLNGQDGHEFHSLI